MGKSVSGVCIFGPLRGEFGQDWTIGGEECAGLALPAASAEFKGT